MIRTRHLETVGINDLSAEKIFSSLKEVIGSTVLILAT